MNFTALSRFSDDDLNPNEQVIHRSRLHLVAFLFSSKTWIAIILLGLIILAFSFVYRETIGFLIDGGVTLGVAIVAGGLIFYGGFKFSIRLVDWLYDEDIITNQRIIDYNQKFLFSKDLSTANLKSVEDVILKQDGFLRTIFDYGMLDVRTSATASRGADGDLSKYLLLEDIGRPKQVQRLIDQIVNRVKKKVIIDREEMLIMSGLKKGNLDEYFVIKKTRGWKQRMKKLLEWE